MLSWHGLRLEAVCGMGCEEARGTVREKQGGVLVLARDRGQRKRGQGGRTHVEPHHDLGSRGGDDDGVPVAGRYSGRRVEYYMEGVGDLRRGVCIIRD